MCQQILTSSLLVFVLTHGRCRSRGRWGCRPLWISADLQHTASVGATCKANVSSLSPCGPPRIFDLPILSAADVVAISNQQYCVLCAGGTWIRENSTLKVPPIVVDHQSHSYWLLVNSILHEAFA